MIELQILLMQNFMNMIFKKGDKKMELIQTIQIRFNEKEKDILESAFYIIDQLYEDTTDYDLSNLTEKLLDGLKKLEEYYV